MRRYPTDRSMLLPISCFGLACFACGAALAGAIVSWSKNTEQQKHSVEIAQLREKAVLLEDYFRQSAERGSPSFLGGRALATAQPTEQTTPQGAQTATPSATPSASGPYAPAASRGKPAEGSELTLLEAANAAVQFLERPRSETAEAAGPPGTDTYASKTGVKTGVESTTRAIGVATQSARPPERPLAMRAPGSAKSSAPASTSTVAAGASNLPPAGVGGVTAVTAAQAPAAPPPPAAASQPVATAQTVQRVAPVSGSDPANKIEAVPASKAGVARLELGAVVMLSGKRIRVGEKFESGETLVTVDPDIGRIVTNARTLMLL